MGCQVGVGEGMWCERMVWGSDGVFSWEKAAASEGEAAVGGVIRGFFSGGIRASMRTRLEVGVADVGGGRRVVE